MLRRTTGALAAAGVLALGTVDPALAQPSNPCAPKSPATMTPANPCTPKSPGAAKDPKAGKGEAANNPGAAKK